MAIYLGSSKVGATIARIQGGSNNNLKCLTGTITSDENGVITFPELNFTPNMIVVWNIEERNHKAEAEENGEDWEDGYIQYTYEGIMLFAIRQNGKWISQGLTSDSGVVNITNASFTAGFGDYSDYTTGIREEGNVYSYALHRHPYIGDEYTYDYTDVVFNYAIYG